MKKGFDKTGQAMKDSRAAVRPLHGSKSNQTQTNMQRQIQARGEFTILRSAEQVLSGSQEPLRVNIQPTPIKLSNARGRLRMVDSADIRTLAGESAKRIINALSGKV